MSGHPGIAAVVTAGALALVLSAGALAASGKPDGHDRALAAILSAKVTTFRQISGATKDDSVQKSLDNCAFIKKNPKDAFAAIFALIPVLLIDVVNDYGPELTTLRNSLETMHPDSPLFAQWLTAETDSLSLILEFDNHGQKIDVCDAATVLLDKKTTAADLKRLLGIDPTLLAKLFTSPVSAKLDKLNPKMRTFLVATGVSKKNANILTSND